MAGSYDIYNRGAFGFGFSSSNFINSRRGGTGSSISFQPNAIKLHTEEINIYRWDTRAALAITNLINFTPYKTLNVTLSNTYGYHKGNSVSTQKMYLSIHSSSGVIGGYDGGDITSLVFSPNSSNTEKTLTLDVSGINKSGYISIDHYYTYDLYGSDKTKSHSNDAYVYRIWFT